jgi:SnoaL-like protein
MDRAITTDELQAARRIYLAWDDALGRKNLDDSMKLYTEEATLESALVRHVLGTDTGIIRGKRDLREFVRILYERPLPQRERFREELFTDGRILMWEYPRLTPTSEQIDLVEVMELKDGLIHRHRVYWGWFGVRALEKS